MTPKAGECLVCFVARQLDEFGYDGTHRFALHYRDSVAPRATALLRHLSAMGACCCDCEMFMNGFKPVKKMWAQAQAQAQAQVSVDKDGLDEERAGPESLNTMPLCETTRRGSTQPCASWKRIPRSRYR
ncbi:DUF2695 domain-containing protein [Leifsonia sp. A12D58]|uniref:DUF2695 domain-containing protein n=1 Tax=Leifsonia sp. A12D58 TaxID=3397674 RepID=UPI0039DFC9DC